MWKVWVDTGGTFTDCIALDPRGAIHRAKLLSSGGVRGVVCEWIDDSTFIADVATVMSAPCAIGWRFRCLDDSGSDAQTAIVVTAAEHDGGLQLKINQPWQGPRRDGQSIELFGDEPAPTLAARLVTQTAMNETLPDIAMRLGTTRGTNALLERRVARTALFVTNGFRDLLVIGDQQRPDLFALKIEKSPPLYETVVEVNERIAANGTVIEEIDIGKLRDAAIKIRESGIEVAAVSLASSYINDKHERAAESVLRDCGFKVISRSAALAPLIGYLSRTETAVVNAALTPIVGEYINAVQRGVQKLHVMTSAGGLVTGEKYRAMDSLLSGPAGGVAGAAAAAKSSGFEKIIGFDMGGTSTDVARYDGDFEYQFEQKIGGTRVVSPALAIETVAAGGGSICTFERDRLIVGPESAGAVPGPACYGAGGPLAITDVNLLAGRIDTKRFSIPLDVDAARRALDDRCKDAERETGYEVNPDDVLDGFLAIANERMASAIERISLRRGYDPADYALVAFGGAGGQHACAVAEKLGMTTVIVSRDASLLSAVGLGHAVIERFAQRQVLRALDECGDEWQSWFDELAQQAIDEVAQEGVDKNRILVRRRLAHLRLRGQDSTIAIDVNEETAQLSDAFIERYEQLYGYPPPEKPIEIESMRVVASGLPDDDALRDGREQFRAANQSAAKTRMRVSGMWHDVPVRERDTLQIGESIDGPALIVEDRSVTVVEMGWRASVDQAGAIVIKADKSIDRQINKSSEDNRGGELARAELFAHRFTSIAADMGQLLQRTAMSVNVKQRLDFSCAVLSPAGELIVNAPHIPVHLGAMGVCVREVRKVITIGPGDVVITNHPGFGGSHLPDVTVISGAFDTNGELIGYVANRAHHAEIGGVAPGSMTPNATRLIEEGVIIEPQYLVRRNEPQFDQIENVLRSAKHPSRAVEENIADLRAQSAANRFGVDALRKLAIAHGVQELHRQMETLALRAETIMREVFASLPDRVRAEEKLDDGSPICVKIERRGDELTIDFAGTAAQHPGNLNAPPAVTHSAILYVLRLLAGRDMPLNEAMLRPVRIVIPRGMLNPDFSAPGYGFDALPAVVGGNVETSQRVVDTLLKALGIVACSQGTMNNVLFGNERFGYYETICGGTGAGPGFDGTGAVHSHMTNTRITDVEVMEQRYPVRVRRFEVRQYSGGEGKFRGGDGVIRELEFREPVTLSILSQHRVERPYGKNGGGAGALGSQYIIRASGKREELRGIDGAALNAGDRFIIETPGGGGWGERTR